MPRKIWPDRSVADFLVGMFLREINQIYDLIQPLSFQSRYTLWWATNENKDASSDANLSDEDLDFGLLIVRISLLSLQSLPHSQYSTADILHTCPNQLEQWLYSTAGELDRSRPAKKPSLVTVQHRFYHASYLRNYGRIRECWSALSATIRDAHEFGLHLKDPGVSSSELDLEFRRRMFWTLYVWDRYVYFCQ